MKADAVLMARLLHIGRVPVHRRGGQHQPGPRFSLSFWDRHDIAIAKGSGVVHGLTNPLATDQVWAALPLVRTLSPSPSAEGACKLQATPDQLGFGIQNGRGVYEPLERKAG